VLFTNSWRKRQNADLSRDYNWPMAIRPADPPRSAFCRVPLEIWVFCCCCCCCCYYYYYYYYKMWLSKKSVYSVKFSRNFLGGWSCRSETTFLPARGSKRGICNGNVAGWLAGLLAGCHTPVLYQNG